MRARSIDVHGFSAFTRMGTADPGSSVRRLAAINLYSVCARGPSGPRSGIRADDEPSVPVSQSAMKGSGLVLLGGMTAELVVVGVPDYATALTLRVMSNSRLGCIVATSLTTVNQPLRTCASPRYGAAPFTSSLPQPTTPIPIHPASGPQYF